MIRTPTVRALTGHRLARRRFVLFAPDFSRGCLRPGLPSSAVVIIVPTGRIATQTAPASVQEDPRRSHGPRDIELGGPVIDPSRTTTRAEPRPEPSFSKHSQKERNMRILALFVAVLTTLVAGCCLDPVDGSRYFCFGEVSDEEEAAMGQQYAEVFTAESGGVYPDPALQAYLGEIVLGMAKNSERPTLPWNFTILNTSQINAFALPGGEVFVTRGLLSKLESEAQFAHLMGHEVGHVTHRHSLKGQGRTALLGLLVGVGAVADQVVLDEDSPRIFSTIAGTGGQLVFLKYSRDQEIQSDARGVDYALAAGYDPLAGKRTFEMFLELKGGGESKIQNLMSTHPLDTDRISAIDSYVSKEKAPLPASLIVNTPRFEQYLTAVRSAQEHYSGFDQALALIGQAQEESQPALLDQAQTLLEHGRRALPQHAPFTMGLGVVALERNQLSEARSLLDAAVQIDSRLFSARLYRGVVMRKQNALEEAEAELTAAHELHAYHPLPCYLLGSIHESKGRMDKAREWYEATIARSPQGSDLRDQARERLEQLGS